MNDNNNFSTDNYTSGSEQFGSPRQMSYVTPTAEPKRPNRFLLVLRGLFYPLLYTVVQNAVVLVYVIIKVASMMVGALGINSEALDMAQITDQIYNDLEGQYVALIAAALLTFGIVLVITRVRKRPLKEEFHMKAIDPRVGVLAFISGLSLNFTVLFAMNFLPESILEDYAQDVQYSGSIVVYILAGVICAPIIEEIIYRNFSLMRFKSAMPVWLAVLLSAAVFGVAHWSLVQSTYAALLGALLAIMFIRTGSIFTGILIHFGFNSVSIISLVLDSIEMNRQTEMLVNLIFYGVTLVSIAVCVFSVIGMFLLTSNDRKQGAPAAPVVNINGDGV